MGCFIHQPSKRGHFLLLGMIFTFYFPLITQSSWPNNRMAPCCMNASMSPAERRLAPTDGETEMEEKKIENLKAAHSDTLIKLLPHRPVAGVFLSIFWCGFFSFNKTEL